jgi:hypothetical protein
MTRFRLGSLMCCVLLAAAGCAASSGGKFPEYNVIRLYNDSSADIYDIELSAGATVTSLDRLPAEHSPVSDRGVSPDPKMVEVSWRTEDGRRPQAEVPVARDLPPGFRGVILLRLKPEGDVDTEFIPYGELK